MNQKPQNENIKFIEPASAAPQREKDALKRSLSRGKTLERKKTAFDVNNDEQQKPIIDQYYSELSERFQELEQRRRRQLEKFHTTNKEDILRDIEQFKKCLQISSTDAELEKILNKGENIQSETEINVLTSKAQATILSGNQSQRTPKRTPKQTKSGDWCTLKKKLGQK